MYYTLLLKNKWKAGPWTGPMLAVLILFIGNGCSTVKPYSDTAEYAKRYKVMGKWYEPRLDSHGFRQTGLASWYGKDFHGKKTANGETYNMYAMTAAHKTLPFNTYVRVHNLENGQRIDVRVNDRGPFVRGRIIDLSYTAAQEIGIVGPGTARVKIVALGKVDEPLSKSEQQRSYLTVDYYEGNFTFQVGAFLERQNAERLKAKLAKTYINAHITTYQKENDTFYRVRVGKFSNLNKAIEYEKILKNDGYDPIIVAE
jgi:rare lipoprotein A